MNPNDAAARPQQTAAVKAGVRLWVTKTIIFMLLLVVLLFGLAGRLDWPGAWVYLGLTGIIQVVNAVVLSPELLAERSRPGAGTKKWDLVLASGMASWGPLLLYIVAALDARYGWTAPLPTLLLPLAALITLVGALFITWAMRANPFFSGTVRIQAERGHRVAENGPYRLVRHPGYAAVVVLYLVTPLVFGSLWAYLPALLIEVITFIRTALEDRTLQAELPGYREYAARVRFRLIPGVW